MTKILETKINRSESPQCPDYALKMSFYMKNNQGSLRKWFIPDLEKADNKGICIEYSGRILRNTVHNSYYWEGVGEFEYLGNIVDSTLFIVHFYPFVNLCILSYQHDKIIKLIWREKFLLIVIVCLKARIT